MTQDPNRPTVAFRGATEIARGPLLEIALMLRAAGLDAEGVLVFDDATGAVIDLDLRGDAEAVAARLTPPARPRPRGRPKLGVTAREVTLLPRHWAWLAAQPGGASAALRRLVEEAARADGGETATRAAREAAYRFLTALAGDLPGYEAAIRALFAGDVAGFAARMEGWPEDIRAHALRLAETPPPAA